MKRILLLLFVTAFITSCDENNTGRIVECNKEGGTKIFNVYGVRYYLIQLEGHDYLFRRWPTYGGMSSDLEHYVDCRKCKK